MSEKIKLSFSEKADGIIWKTLADPDHNRLYTEVRNHEQKRVYFSAMDLDRSEWIWKNLEFEEPWWISLLAVSGDILLLTLYTDTNNPDQKSLVAFNINQRKIVWSRSNFVVIALSKDCVTGVDMKFGSRKVTLSLKEGNNMSGNEHLLPDEQNFIIIRPFQYPEGNMHFETVRAFLEMKCQISPIISIEYCEYHSLILISAFIRQNDLANYLFVFNSAGDLVLRETLGEHLKGIALDTFFIFSGYLIFVKNKSELVSYKLV